MSAIEQRFKKLEAEWHRRTALQSSTTRMVNDPSYQEVIAMGWEVVPVILRSLAEKPDHWFYALAKITGDNPIPPEDAGNVPKMTEAWLDWGRRKGLV